MRLVRTIITLIATLAAAFTATTGLAAGAGADQSSPAQAAESSPTLTGWAVLAADTFVRGSEPSGWFTGNPAAPFPGQPVQGFSGVHALADGTFLTMSDNGYGAKANSQDFLLRVHHIKPDTATGSVTVLGGVSLSDPSGLIPWTTWRDGGCAAAASLPAGYTCPAPDRQLTGWDFDIESLQVATDGTLWFGDEFGPFLLHADAQGRLLEAPIPTPGIVSPSNPTLQPGQTPNIVNSKGFEGMAISPNGKTLYPMLEGSTAEDKAAGLTADLRIYEVTVGNPQQPTRFTGDFKRYRMESEANALGDFIAVNDHEFLVIERDSLQGDAAKFKRIYLVDTRDRNRDGYVDKTLLVDLMNVANPNLLGGQGNPFTFPYFTIEDVEILDATTIAVLNDNNYPAAGGRGATVKDVNEFLQITLPTPLRVDHRLLPAASSLG